MRACLGSSCLDTTADANGGYAFVDVAPGAYVVRALPGDPALLAAQTTADVTLQSLSGVDLRLATSGSGGSDAGPSTFRVAGCTGGTLHYVATADGVSLGSGDVTDGAGGTPVDGVYTIDISSLNPGHAAMLQLDITITCASTTETQTALLFADPSGTVVDDNAAGSALAGATVTLLDAAGNAIPSGDPRLSAATSANPETSDARGAWGWDVAPGTYRVTATKDGCGTATSAALTVTPTNPVTNVVLHLACAVPSPPAPPAPAHPARATGAPDEPDAAADDAARPRRGRELQRDPDLGHGARQRRRAAGRPADPVRRRHRRDRPASSPSRRSARPACRRRRSSTAASSCSRSTPTASRRSC